MWKVKLQLDADSNWDQNRLDILVGEVKCPDRIKRESVLLTATTSVYLDVLCGFVILFLAPIEYIVKC